MCLAWVYIERTSHLNDIQIEYTNHANSTTPRWLIIELRVRIVWRAGFFGEFVQFDGTLIAYLENSWLFDYKSKLGSFNEGYLSLWANPVQVPVPEILSQFCRVALS